MGLDADSRWVHPVKRVEVETEHVSHMQNKRVHKHKQMIKTIFFQLTSLNLKYQLLTV